MELALLEAWRRKEIPLPVITVDFSGNHLKMRCGLLASKPRTVWPMRISGTATWARKDFGSRTGKRLDQVDTRNATALFALAQLR